MIARPEVSELPTEGPERGEWSIETPLAAGTSRVNQSAVENEVPPGTTIMHRRRDVVWLCGKSREMGYTAAGSSAHEH